MSLLFVHITVAESRKVTFNQKHLSNMDQYILKWIAVITPDVLILSVISSVATETGYATTKLRCVTKICYQNVLPKLIMFATDYTYLPMSSKVWKKIPHY